MNYEEINAYFHNPEEDNLEVKSIKNMSPFPDFYQIKSKIELQISDDTLAFMEENTLHYPEIIDCLNESLTNHLPMVGFHT